MIRRLGHLALLTLVVITAWPALARAQQPDARAAGAARWHHHIEAVCREVGCEPDLLEALVASESGGDPRAVSPAGAVGLSQLMPATARALGVNPHDPLDNLRGGARYLMAELRACGGNEACALAGYNCGRVCGMSGRWPAETRAFVPVVQRRAARLRAGRAPLVIAETLRRPGSRLAAVAVSH